MNDDLIRRGVLLRALDKSIAGMREIADGNGVMTKAIKLVQIARDFADNLPAVDAAEVIRCKDCIHWSADCGTDETVCLKIYSDGAASAYAWQERKPDDFCSYGERRETMAKYRKKPVEVEAVHKHKEQIAHWMPLPQPPKGE